MENRSLRLAIENIRAEERMRCMNALMQYPGLTDDEKRIVVMVLRSLAESTPK